MRRVLGKACLEPTSRSAWPALDVGGTSVRILRGSPPSRPKTVTLHPEFPEAFKALHFQILKNAETLWSVRSSRLTGGILCQGP